MEEADPADDLCAFRLSHTGITFPPPRSEWVTELGAVPCLAVGERGARDGCQTASAKIRCPGQELGLSSDTETIKIRIAKWPDWIPASSMDLRGSEKVHPCEAWLHTSLAFLPNFAER